MNPFVIKRWGVAHLWNLVFKNGAEKLREVTDMESFINEISSFIRGSPNREDTLKRELEALGCQVRRPMRNMPVRWVSVLKPAHNMITSFEGILRTLQKFKEKDKESKKWLEGEMDQKISRVQNAGDVRVVLGPMPPLVRRVRKMFSTPCVATLAVLTDCADLMVRTQSLLSKRNLSLMDLNDIIKSAKTKVSVFVCLKRVCLSPQCNVCAFDLYF